MAYRSASYFADHLGRLLAINADRAPSCNLPGAAAIAPAFKTVDRILRNRPANTVSQLEYLAILRRVCWGAPNPPRPPARPRLSKYFKNDPNVSVIREEWLSTVVTFESIYRLMSRKDLSRFERKFRVSFSPRRPGMLDRNWVSRFRAIPATDLHFRLKSKEGHGRPLVWFAPRSAVETSIQSAPPRGMSHADMLRDRLGLVHHQPHYDNDPARPKHLFVLHVPAGILGKAENWRPAAIEAVDNPRFMVRSSDPSVGPAGPWGQTADLFKLLLGSSPFDGHQERVLLRLQASLFDPREVVEFGYLGQIMQGRGMTPGADTDADYITKLDPTSQAGRLVRAIWP